MSTTTLTSHTQLSITTPNLNRINDLGHISPTSKSLLHGLSRVGTVPALPVWCRTTEDANQQAPGETQMINYNGYRIGATCSKSPLYFIQALRNKKWTDLFFGIESLDKAKRMVDNWTIAVQILG